MEARADRGFEPLDRVSPRIVSVRLRDFRSYASAQIALGDRLTVITGPNGTGKTNLIEALYFGCTGRSCRTSNEREVVRFGAQATRVIVTTAANDGAHELSVGFQPGEPKRMKADGAPVERLLDVPDRPLVSVFLPDRLELIKGAPALRRGHLDAFVAALWPARAQIRRGRRVARGIVRAGTRRHARQLGRPARPARARADGRPRGRGRRDRARLRAAVRGARP